MTRILALDFGLKRIGVALGDTDSGIAFPREVLTQSESVTDEILDLAEQESVSLLLLGNPLRRDGSPGGVDAELQAFAEKLRSRFTGEIVFVDERFTSKIATQRLHDIDMSEKHQRGLKDSLAAQIMLQEWLDQ